MRPGNWSHAKAWDTLNIENIMRSRLGHRWNNLGRCVTMWSHCYALGVEIYRYKFRTRIKHSYMRRLKGYLGLSVGHKWSHLSLLLLNLIQKLGNCALMNDLWQWCHTAVYCIYFPLFTPGLLCRTCAHVRVKLYRLYTHGVLLLQIDVHLKHEGAHYF